jgi:hypothetical protein
MYLYGLQLIFIIKLETKKVVIIKNVVIVITFTVTTLKSKKTRVSNTLSLEQAVLLYSYCQIEILLFVVLTKSKVFVQTASHKYLGM